jgi:hypothetical protein
MEVLIKIKGILSSYIIILNMSYVTYKTYYFSYSVCVKLAPVTLSEAHRKFVFERKYCDVSSHC